MLSLQGAGCAMTENTERLLLLQELAPPVWPQAQLATSLTRVLDGLGLCPWSIIDVIHVSCITYANLHSE